MPATWKHARVSPIYKTGDKAECGNYRPISFLCGSSKVITTCETALLRMIDLWAAAIDRGDINVVILLDFRKAFDLINHECLLKKLNIYQCDDNANMWFRSYLMLLSHCGEYPCECKKIYSRQIRQKVANIRRMGLRMQFATNRNDRKMIARHS